MWEVIKDAKTSQKNLSAIWLDLANAYGSDPHAAIEFALQWYNIIQSLVTLVGNYYTPDFMQGFQFGIGILTGSNSPSAFSWDVPSLQSSLLSLSTC